MMVGLHVSLFGFLLLQHLGNLSLWQLHHVGCECSVLLVLQLQLSVEVGVTCWLTSEVFSFFVQAGPESIVVVLHEHFPVLVHQRQCQVLLIQSAVPLKVLFLNHVYVFAQILKSELIYLLVLLRENVNLVFPIFQLVFDVVELFDPFIALFLIVSHIMLFAFSSSVDFFI